MVASKPLRSGHCTSSTAVLFIRALFFRSIVREEAEKGTRLRRAQAPLQDAQQETDRLRLFPEFRGEHVYFFDGRRLREQLGGFGHQSGGYLPIQMRLRAALVFLRIA